MDIPVYTQVWLPDSEKLMTMAAVRLAPLRTFLLDEFTTYQAAWARASQGKPTVSFGEFGGLGIGFWEYPP